MRTSVRNKNLKRLQKYLNKKQRRGRRKQQGGFLNRYGFTYAGRDTVNYAMKGLKNILRKMIDGTVTDKIYHGCAPRFSNGERKLIDFEKGECCICATANPFWKEPNTCYRMQTRESTKNRQLIKGPYRYVYKNLQ